MEMVSMLGMLGVLSVEDVKTKEIRKQFILLFGILGLVLHLIFQRIDIWNILGGLSIGLVLLGISYFSREQIGKGDGVLFLVTGIFLGFWENLMLLWSASLLMGIYAMIMCAMGRLHRDDRIPFIPFVLICYVIGLAMKGAGIL
ncbi:MAG TPA: hypothetical protein DCP96_03015 [Lachnospiraceae bacterium]|jgi:leader peptidase (prepilin peptidase)/N-methyltransferase|nr:prepilin peptidase [Lachnospiraceae bacterium]MDD6148161.1 prepilin peptidase [Lachnospiraceae bacterium]MEE3357137.1 prepilin peptidase [Lachnospiraceae bacterium]HAN50654.1 hypothetical protein [Lachnospiraceae bacterium]HBE08462.1 hypothetical protein [Lachnospiraceae bacterium]